MVRSPADMTGTERPIRPRRTTPAARLIALVTATALVGAGTPAHAQQKGPPVVRDAEIEQLLREYTQPILRAAGLAQQNVQVVIINDRSFNAFVADGRRIFVNGGVLMGSETPKQIIRLIRTPYPHNVRRHFSGPPPTRSAS